MKDADVRTVPLKQQAHGSVKSVGSDPRNTPTSFQRLKLWLWLWFSFGVLHLPPGWCGGRFQNTGQGFQRHGPAAVSEHTPTTTEPSFTSLCCTESTYHSLPPSLLPPWTRNTDSPGTETPVLCRRCRCCRCLVVLVLVVVAAAAVVVVVVSQPGFVVARV